MATIKKAKKAPASPPVPVTMPDTFGQDESTAALLVNHNLIADAETRSVEAVSAVLEQLSSRSDVKALRAWARTIVWLSGAGTEFRVASLADLTPPTVLDDHFTLQQDVSTLDEIRNWATFEGQSQIVDDVAIAPDAPVPFDVTEAGQLALVTDDEVTVKAITGLEFNSADEALSTAHALKGRADELEKAAKKLSDLGRQTESRALLREARHIRETLLSQIQPQVVIPFNTAESLPAAITRVVGTTVRTAVVRAMKNHVVVGDGETYDEVMARRTEEMKDFERLIGHIAEHSAAAVMPVLRETAERNFEAGLAQRRSTPDVITREAVQAVSAAQMAVA